ncbi:MAG: CPBP family intramembrane metalloprotease [Candidatus Omnitrophica bacterium]|nr:CPBP family intramembrane metalloprotease [Candidatus Omnitrophota bacterium]
MTGIGYFLRKERLYILLLVFIILMNVLMGISDEDKGKTGKAIDFSLEKKKEGIEDIFLKREEMEKVLRQKKPLAMLFSLASLLVLAILSLGIVIDVILASLKMSKKTLDIQTHKVKVVRWNVLDVSRVVILFLFFGYMVILIESALIGTFPILKNDNFRMMLNSSILDVLGVIFVIYFTVVQYKEDLVSLGLSIKNFFKNVFYGMAGYIATVPVLIGVLAVIVLIIHLTKYVPEKQPVVELFLKEENAPFLVYSSVFAAVVGPFIEELFFRGFMYNAFKKYIGIFWATIFTAGIFAALHTNIVGFLPIMILGITLAYLYEKTGTLVSSITVHIIHNLSMVFLIFLIKQVKA